MHPTAHKGFIVAALLVATLAACWGTFSMADGAPRVIPVTARKFKYTPQVITLKKGVPVVLELISLDRLHGFNAPGLGIRADVMPGQTARVHILPQKTGTFPFHCDNFCGSGHQNMTGEIIVVD